MGKHKILLVDNYLQVIKQGFPTRDGSGWFSSSVDRIGVWLVPGTAPVTNVTKLKQKEQFVDAKNRRFLKVYFNVGEDGVTAEEKRSDFIKKIKECLGEKHTSIREADEAGAVRPVPAGPAAAHSPICRQRENLDDIEMSFNPVVPPVEIPVPQAIRDVSPQDQSIRTSVSVSPLSTASSSESSEPKPQFDWNKRAQRQRERLERERERAEKKKDAKIRIAALRKRHRKKKRQIPDGFVNDDEWWQKWEKKTRQNHKVMQRMKWGPGLKEGRSAETFARRNYYRMGYDQK